MPICPTTKKYNFILFLTEKTPTFLSAILHPFGPECPSCKHVRFEFNLHITVKLYPDPLRFAGVIPKKPILSDYIVCCLHALHDSIQT